MSDGKQQWGAVTNTCDGCATQLWVCGQLWVRLMLHVSSLVVMLGSMRYWSTNFATAADAVPDTGMHQLVAAFPTLQRPSSSST